MVGNVGGNGLVVKALQITGGTLGAKSSLMLMRGNYQVLGFSSVAIISKWILLSCELHEVAPEGYL